MDLLVVEKYSKIFCRLKQLSDNPPDIMLSHDWPNGVTDYGDVDKLLRFKKHFREEIEQNRLGSPPARDILDTVKPEFWFSAHLHCKFAAIIPHQNTQQTTKFLALDKCLPRRQFLQVVEIGDPVGEDDSVVMKYCPTWLAILRSTNHLLSVERRSRYTPGPGGKERWDFRPTEEEVSEVKKLLKDDLEVPYNFEQTALAYKETGGKLNMRNVPKPQPTTNNQTTEFCAALGIHDPMALLLGRNNPSIAQSVKNNFTYNKFGSDVSTEMVKDTNEIDISNIDDDTEEINEEASSTSITAPSITPMSIPQPKHDNSQSTFLSVIQDMGSQEPDKSSEPTNLFMIDTAGADTDQCKNDNPEPTDQPMKKLKRRNAAMYENNE